MSARRRLVLPLALAASLVAGSGDARAYEFEIRARTLGQAYQLPALYLVGGELWLARRRLTESLSLTLWDLGDLRRRRLRERPGRADPGPVVWLSAHLRLDHDLGEWTTGTVDVGGRTLDALDAIPELADQSLGLELVHGAIAVDGLWDRVDLRLGRQLHLDDVDAWALDGVSARVRTPWPVVLEAMAGLRVRDASPLGLAAVELDGTPGADCREYVEGPTPGSGSWQIIDRSRVPGESPLRSDLAYCPQREQAMPMAGLAVEVTPVTGVRARVAYRRAQSRTTGLIGEVDRLDHPDQGLYPDEAGQAPAWGVNEELVSASVEGRWRPGRARRWTVAPWLRGRYSLVDASVADASVGVRVERGAHALEPALSYARPLLDADSIWSVFVTGGSTDVRLDYQLAPPQGPVRASALAWVRRYDVPSAGMEVAASATGSWVGGGRVRGELTVAPGLVTGVDVLADDGYGGRRLGATAHTRWRARRDLSLVARLGGLHVATDQRASTGGGSGAAQLGARWAIDGGLSLDGAAELSTSPRAGGQLRVVVQLTVALAPEYVP